MSRKSITSLGLLLVVIAAGILIVYLRPHKILAPSHTHQSDKKAVSNQTPAPVEQKPLFSLDDPTSIWVVANKQRPLAASFVPTDLVGVVGGQQMRTEAATALGQLIGGASQANIGLKAISGYRSYTNQASVYSGYVKTDGQAKADTYSARPGHSEHQTGLAIDLGASNGQCDLQICFGDTAAGKWLAVHAHEYGFIIRYANNKTAITGYQYEPWHIRYVGTDLAKKLYDSGKTMEEYFNLPAAPSY